MNHHSILRQLVRLGLVVLVTLATGTASVAAVAPAQATTLSVETATASGDLHDAAALEAFFDARLAESMERNHVPGAVLTVVHEGEVVLLKGYGHADVESGIPVDPEGTVFYTGSVGKVVTTTGVMQLVEDGTVDLDSDVTEYVDVGIPATYDDPITLRHLGTHTSGFAYETQGILTYDPADVPTLETFVKTELPTRVRAPGTASAYDNHGLTLMGYVIEQQSGRTYETYIEDELFVPLGMADSTVAVPVPDRLASNVATGYHYENGEFVVADPIYARVAPAGSFATTGADMAQFLRANLDRGCVETACVLDAESVEEMHATQFRGHPEINGMAFGFEEYDRNGQRVLGKGGDTTVFSADLWVMPDREFGVFLAFNAPGGGLVRGEVYGAFMDEYFPDDRTVPTTVLPGFEDRAATIAGAYQVSRVSQTDHTKVLGLLETVRVDVVDEGVISLSVPNGVKEYVEVDHYVFEDRAGSGNRIAFVVDESGTVRLFSDGFVTDHLRKLAVHERPIVHIGILGGSLLVMLTGLVGWPGVALYRRLRGGRPARGIGDDGSSAAVARSDGGRQSIGTARRTRWLAGGAIVAVLGAVVGVLYMIVTDLYGFMLGTHPLLLPVTVLPVVAGGLLIAAVGAGVAARTDPAWGRLARIHFALVALAVGAVLAELVRYNLVPAL